MFSRPRRRRRWLWWLIPLAIAIALLALLTGVIRTENRLLVAYFDQTRPLIRDTGEVAESFGDLIKTQLQTVSRDDFEGLMGRLHSRVEENQVDLNRLQAPDPASAVNDLQTQAFRFWVSGLDLFRSSMTQLVDEPMAEAPVDDLASAIAEIRVGDLLYNLAYERSLSLVESLDVTVGDLTQVAFVSADPILLNADILARTVRNSTAMAMRNDVGILQVVFDPLATGAEGDQGEIIFPAVDRLRFSAVVGNRGNVDQKSLFVSANFRDQDGVVSTQDSSGIDLAAGENRSVLFDAVTVEPGRSYTLTFSITVVEAELHPEDNTWESGIIFNPVG